jgi:hypothetical protein
MYIFKNKIVIDFNITTNAKEINMEKKWKTLNLHGSLIVCNSNIIRNE